jgi:AraC-like DNA-binding protein
MLLAASAGGRELLEDVREPPLSIKDIAREIGMSPFHFIRQFEAVFGLTPHQFRIQSRLNQAKLLLAMGHHSGTEVCMEVGMSSLGSFSSLFAGRVGATPSSYQEHASDTRVFTQASSPLLAASDSQIDGGVSKGTHEPKSLTGSGGIRSKVHAAT